MCILWLSVHPDFIQPAVADMTGKEGIERTWDQPVLSGPSLECHESLEFMPAFCLPETNNICQLNCKGGQEIESSLCPRRGNGKVNIYPVFVVAPCTFWSPHISFCMEETLTSSQGWQPKILFRPWKVLLIVFQKAWIWEPWVWQRME